MDIRNCKSCGKIFTYVSGPQICKECQKKIETKFRDVKRFVRDNPEASLVEISESCEVEVKQLRQWVREERLTFSKESAIGIECERCGTVIKTGRYCDKCKSEVSNELSGMYQEKPKEEPKEEKESGKNRMRYLNRDR